MDAFNDEVGCVIIMRMSSLKGGVASVRRSLKRGVASVRSSLKTGGVASVRRSLKGGVASARRSLKGGVASVTSLTKVKIGGNGVKGNLFYPLFGYIEAFNEPS